MTSKEVTDLLLVIQATITLLVSVRAFSSYRYTRSPVLFSIGLSMGIIALGGIVGLLGDTLLASSLYNTLWFRYIGQTVGYFFIFLITLRHSERAFKHITRWHVVAVVLLLGLLLLTPQLPTSTNPLLVILLSGSRSVVCFAILMSYASIFINKPTRFNLLMGLAFLLITFGIWIYTMKFFLVQTLALDYIGDGVRILGLVLFLIALFVG